MNTEHSDKEDVAPARGRNNVTPARVRKNSSPRIQRRARVGQADRLKLIIADPDPLARSVVRESVKIADGFVLAAEATDGVEALELASHYRPDLLLMEVGLPRIDGVSACREIVERSPTVRVVMFSVPQPHHVQVAALRAGASGFLSKNSPIDATLRALRSVASGDAGISRSLTMHLIEFVRQVPPGGVGMRPVRSNLTSREWEVLDLVCSGATTREIADRLFLSEGTIYTHTKSIMRKLGVKSRDDAIAAAARLRQPADQ